MQKFVAIKSEKELPPVVYSSVEIMEENGSIKEVRFLDPAGTVLFKVVGTYGITVCIPAPPKLVEKHQLAGVFKGLNVLEYFDNKWDAEHRLSDFGEDSGLLITLTKIAEEG